MGFRIDKFPFLANEVSSLPYFISDDFRFMCDYNSRSRRLRILKTDDSSVLGVLPLEALHKSKNEDQRDNMLQVFSCVKIERNECDGSHIVVTFNVETGLYTEWPVV